MEDKIQRMQELVKLLNEAGKAYYQQAKEIMSNFEYDKLYDELQALEQDTGVILSNSPTIQVGYEVISELPKEDHPEPMLSLDKTKDVEELAAFVGVHKSMLSWKMDGLTIVLTYREGELYKAVTRGNGEVGEVITNNARVFRNIPLKISYQGDLILRGEAVIGYSDFEKINAEIGDIDAKYKNPRNLCSGSVRQLNNEITAKRNVKFYAFSLVQAEEVDFKNSRACQMEWLKSQGFETVEYCLVTEENIRQEVLNFSERIPHNDFPSDGLVVTYDDIEYGRSLGRTAKFPRDSYAFKWADEIKETTLLAIEWSPSRTGLINPVAIFEPVELEGTTVSRASVHNLSIMEDLALGVGDKIQVYKANMIIPQIAENLTRSGVKDIPCHCPVCQGPTEIRQLSDAKTLYCINPQCQAKHIKSFALFASRDAMNIDGLSESTLEKFISRGFVKDYVDLFHLDRYRQEIQDMEGFGQKSYKKLVSSLEAARETSLPRLIYSLGISGIGLANAKVLCKAFHNDVEALLKATVSDVMAVDGMGEVLAKAFVDYFADSDHVKRLRDLLNEVRIPEEEGEKSPQIFEGKNFVITGSLNHFANRGQVKELIESLGGKVTGSVTSKTNYLINNDVTSASSKNKKANELKVPIISEEDFLLMVQESK